MVSGSHQGLKTCMAEETLISLSRIKDRCLYAAFLLSALKYCWQCKQDNYLAYDMHCPLSLHIDTDILMT